jgi:GAF domain-containing protein
MSTVSGDQSVEELRCELAEAREQQTATAEILRVISSSPMHLQRAFAEIAASAARLCDAHDATIFRVDGNFLRRIASHGPTPQDATLPLKRELVTGRAVLDLRAIHVADVQADGKEYPVGRENALRLGHRTILTVPLIRGGQAIGVIAIRRTEVCRFTDRQIDLLKTFANQAVIAIENTRLFEAEQARTKELRESLEYQTATSDVLGIISRSPCELQPVFDGIVTTAQRLCEAYDASIVLRDGDRLKLKAHVGPIPMRAEWPLGNRGLVASRSVMDKTTIHVHDLAARGGEFPEGREDALKLGFRSILAVPLVLKGEGIGTMIVRRFEVRPFSDRQIALLATFADQAVIAIENTRLFEAEQASKRELQESLQYQTATAEVLSVISRSPSQLQPVLDAITQTVARLCQADYAHFRLLRDGAYHVASSNNYDPLTLKRLTPIAPRPGSITGRVALECKTVHLPGILTDATGDYSRQYGEIARTGLGVPLMKDGTAVGVIMLFRKTVRPFTERQIALINTFAEQALIAMENTRLFEDVQARTKELQTSLDRQTATAEVLGVISRSPSQTQPVFDAIVATAARLCHAE